MRVLGMDRCVTAVVSNVNGRARPIRRLYYGAITIAVFVP
jgi:hypothetical protein